MEVRGFTVFVVVGLFVVCLVPVVGADDDSHDEDDDRFKSRDGHYECFYDVQEHNNVRFLGAMYCEHGCCGRTHNQRCCTEEEKERKQHKLGGTMVILACTFGGIIAIIAGSIVLYCCCKKKAEMNKAKYNSSAVSSKSNTGHVFTVLQMGPTNSGPSAPPDSFRQYPQPELHHNGGNGVDNPASFPMSPPPPYSQ